jgi:hypothetical protein
METYVAERPETISAPAALVDRSDIATAQRKPAPAPDPRRDDWRWIPDPADVEVPTPARHGPWRSGLVIKALAWVSVQYRA